VFRASGRGVSPGRIGLILRPAGGNSQHDSAGRATAVIDPLNRRTESVFDANGRTTQIKDPLNRITKLVWNARGEKTRTTNPLNHNVDGSFDGNGNQTLLKNRRGKNFTTVFDSANRPTSSTTPTGKTTSMTYFGNGLVKTITEPSSQTTTLAYNGKNLLSSKTDPTGTITYGYDNGGLLTTVTEGTAEIGREYDSRGRLVKFTTADDDEIQYEYDSNGNLTRLTYPDNKQVTYTYNSRNQLATDWNSRVTIYNYDRLGRLTGISRPNGTSASMTYDAAGQLTEQREVSSGKLISYLRFDHDAAGQIERRFRAPLVQSGWQHPQITATYNDDNRLTSFNGQSVTHDSDGNMTFGPISPTSGPINLSYNSRNQLTSAGGVSYTYDAEGRRRTINDANGSTRDVIDPNGSMSRLLVRHHPDSSKTYFVYGIGLLYEVDEAENTKTHHYDQVGSTILRTGDDGKEIGWAEYSVYGLIARQSGDMATPFLYNGQWGITTESNGLLHMRARYYSPYLMRFLNADPIGFSGGLNWFAYADGDPISKSDPFGLWGWTNTFGVLKAVGGALEIAAGAAIGAATGWTGVGAVGGGLVALHGIDTFTAGIHQAFSGEQTDTLTSQGLQAAGLSQSSANMVDAGISILGSVDKFRTSPNRLMLQDLRTRERFRPTYRSGC
jgi:RHS repeat-associated protein